MSLYDERHTDVHDHRDIFTYCYDEEDIKKAIKELKEELDWIKIKDDTGCWSPGQVKMEIERIFGKELVE